METNAKSSFLTKSCGPALDPPSLPFVVRTTQNYNVFEVYCGGELTNGLVEGA